MPVALNRGEANFPRRLREYLVAHPATLGDRKLYLLRNQSRGKGIGFFEAGDFYPDFILWLVKGGRQRIVFVDPKGLAMLKPNDFSQRQDPTLPHACRASRPEIADPDITLDSFIISEQSFTRNPTQRSGTAAHTRRGFRDEPRIVSGGFGPGRGRSWAKSCRHLRRLAYVPSILRLKQTHLPALRLPLRRPPRPSAANWLNCQKSARLPCHAIGRQERTDQPRPSPMVEAGWAGLARIHLPSLNSRLT